MSLPAVVRTALFIPSAPGFLFTSYHEAPDVPPSGKAALLCPPIGHEYASTHRAMRHLADALARAGVPCLRFDYHGTGDSSGDGPEAANPQQWQADIRNLLNELRARSGAAMVGMVGVRFGAMLAAMVATQAASDFLVLWHPCASGRRYIRELRAHAAAAGLNEEADACLETGGVLLPSELLGQLEALELPVARVPATTPVLVLGKAPLAAAAQQLAAPTDFVEAVDIDGMMAEPQFTLVPNTSIAAITGWIARLPGSAATKVYMSRLAGSDVATDADFTEQVCRFGAGDALFGVLRQPRSKPRASVVVMFNAGCQHHVGPNRLYVSLARELAAMGYASFRLDLRGIGESVVSDPAAENVAYPDSAMEDAAAAIEYLQNRHGYQEFILMGLCSGAHTSFHAAVQLGGRFRFPLLVMLNPLTYRWVPGMSLDVTQQAQQASYYAQAMRRRGAWLKLLSGRVNLKNIFGVVVRQVRTLTRAAMLYLREMIGQPSEPLSQELQALWKRPVPAITLYLGDGEPGYALLRQAAPYQARRGQSTGRLVVRRIAGADHVFTRQAARQALFADIRALLGPDKR